MPLPLFFSLFILRSISYLLPSSSNSTLPAFLSSLLTPFPFFYSPITTFSSFSITSFDAPEITPPFSSSSPISIAFSYSLTLISFSILSFSIFLPSSFMSTLTDASPVHFLCTYPFLPTSLHLASQYFELIFTVSFFLEDTYFIIFYLSYFYPILRHLIYHLVFLQPALQFTCP